jgi:predicted RND superfamily exporter protein
MFLISLVTFYVAPAIVIDDSGIFDAIEKSMKIAFQAPLMVLAWVAIGFVALAIIKVVCDLVFGSFSGYVVLLINSLLVLPFLILLQTHMYMEKYPLAR